jgi:hypothetical protein
MFSASDSLDFPLSVSVSPLGLLLVVPVRCRQIDSDYPDDLGPRDHPPPNLPLRLLPLPLSSMMF